MLGHAGRGLENNCAQDFCQSLEEASPEIRACVEACNHIANATREQNDFSSVSWGHVAQKGWGWWDGPSSSPWYEPTGERGMDPGGESDRPRLLLHHGFALCVRHHWHFPHGSLQQGACPALPWGPQDVPAPVTGPNGRIRGSPDLSPNAKSGDWSMG